MQEYNFQKLLSKADENIRIVEEEAKKKEEKAKKKAIEEQKERERKTKILELDILKIIAETLTNIKSNTGVVNKLSGISKYGDLKEAKWTLDEAQFQMILDFSYNVPGDALCPTSRGFVTKDISWEYLCQLLQEENIMIEHNESRYTKYEKYGYDTTYHTDVLIITLERAKKMETEDPSASPSGFAR